MNYEVKFDKNHITGDFFTFFYWSTLTTYTVQINPTSNSNLPEEKINPACQIFFWSNIETI